MDRIYNEINDTIKINFELPKLLENLLEDAEEADMRGMAAR